MANLVEAAVGDPVASARMRNGPAKKDPASDRAANVRAARRRRGRNHRAEIGRNSVLRESRAKSNLAKGATNRVKRGPPLVPPTRIEIRRRHPAQRALLPER